jgi:CO/xanthine dehydrogenase Mo-binding subunit
LAEVHGLTIASGSRFAPVFGRGNVANPEKAPAMSVHLARVKVDRETGDVQLTGYDAIHDIGRAINPSEVEAQIHGGVVQGYGWALREALIYDDHGQLLTGSFMDYALPKAADLPPIDANLVENPAPFGPFGAKGVGEAPVVAPAAAIANALTNAIGVRFTELPITSEHVWRALNSAEAGASSSPIK